MGDVSHTGHRKHHPKANFKFFQIIPKNIFQGFSNAKASYTDLKSKEKTLLNHI
jgi:hypothetical protein